MENIWLNMKDPEFWKFMMIVGGIIVAFNLIRLIVVACKVRKVEAHLYDGAEAFDGMAVGCGFIAIGGFVCEMPVVGIIAAIFAFIFFCCDRKYRWIYYALPRQRGSFHVCESENSANQS